jgi:hypothetical protein
MASLPRDPAEDENKNEENADAESAFVNRELAPVQTAPVADEDAV